MSTNGKKLLVMQAQHNIMNRDSASDGAMSVPLPGLIVIPIFTLPARTSST